MTDRKTVAGAYAKIDGHEAECALRYGHIADTLEAFKDKLDSSHRRAGRIELAAWSLLIGLVGTLLAVVIKLTVPGV